MNEPTNINRPCKKCEGKGTRLWKGFTTQEGRIYPDENKICYDCKGNGYFEPLNIPAICAEIKGRKGLKSKRPDSKRAYYVWRMARFHGGADVTMPVCAIMDVGADAFLPELDKLADAVAKRVFGTDKAAAYRWMGALGHDVTVPDNMPPSAFSCGPVADGNKPESELMELH